MENSPQAGQTGSFTPLPGNLSKHPGGSKKPFMVVVVVFLIFVAAAAGFFYYQSVRQQEPLLEMPAVTEQTAPTPTPEDNLSPDDSVETIEGEIDQTTVEQTPAPTEETTLEEDVPNL